MKVSNLVHTWARYAADMVTGRKRTPPKATLLSKLSTSATSG